MFDGLNWPVIGEKAPLTEELSGWCGRDKREPLMTHLLLAAFSLILFLAVVIMAFVMTALLAALLTAFLIVGVLLLLPLLTAWLLLAALLLFWIVSHEKSPVWGLENNTGIQKVVPAALRRYRDRYRTSFATRYPAKRSPFHRNRRQSSAKHIR